MPTVCRSPARLKVKVGTDPAGRERVHKGGKGTEGSKETNKPAGEKKPRGKMHIQTGQWREQRTHAIHSGKKVVGLCYLCWLLLCQVDIS